MAREVKYSFLRENKKLRMAIKHRAESLKQRENIGVRELGERTRLSYVLITNYLNEKVPCLTDDAIMTLADYLSIDLDLVVTLMEKQ